MPQIFLSHSKGDEDICKFFLQVGGLAGIEIKAMEYENVDVPAWKYIRSQLLKSETCFVLLGKNVIDRGIFTQNWVSFEVGVVCGIAHTIAKEVWVFEPRGFDVKFPVPFLSHYVLYDMNERVFTDYIREIMERYKVPRSRRKALQGIPIVCPNCKVRFELHTEVKEFDCPACRKGIKLI